MSLTPIHFYAHSFEIDHVSTQALDDCSYVNLVNLGQGYSITPDVLNFADAKFIENNNLEETHYYKALISTNNSLYFQLRAPPVLNR